MKTCTKCNARKPFSEFSKNSACRDGFNTRCKKCVNQRVREHNYPPTDKLKHCNRCGETKSADEFWNARRNADGKQSQCKTCEAAYRREKSFGITQWHYDTILRAQGGMCAICFTTEPANQGRWYIDHDHACCSNREKTCGKCFRGLLCFHCNVVLGHISDDISILESAIRYLKERGINNG